MVRQYFFSYGQNRRSSWTAEVWRWLGSPYFGFSTSFKSTMLFFSCFLLFVYTLGP